MYKGKKVSVTIATYREKKSIRKVIDSFWQTGFVDEIIVVNNNAEPGTDAEIKRGKAKIIYEPRQGYGYAYQTALDAATGDYIIACEADGTLTGKDLEKFLLFGQEFPVVFGSRTSLIPSLLGTGMGVVRKFANVIEAKTIEVLFNTNALTDVGCTYKLFSRKALDRIKPLWHHSSALFNTELMLLVIGQKIPFIEIPVTYLKRVGKSQIVGSKLQVFKWALVIQIYIFWLWLKQKLMR